MSLAHVQCFEIKHIAIFGLHNISSNELLDGSALHKKMSIFQVDLEALQRHIKQNPWIMNCAIRRVLPDELRIYVVEKKPLAIWQTSGHKRYLIDQEGLVISENPHSKFLLLPKVVGIGSNIHAHNLINMLKSHPDIFSLMKFAVMFGQRRWDLVLENKTRIKLPERNADQAMHTLEKIRQTNDVMRDLNVKSVDMRDLSRVYIER